jgi:3-hydroxyisobutyrate dehydrogenase-like beta-hydroxyacid dehydrogenase
VIGLLHPGQMGAAIGREMVYAGHTVLWCREDRGTASARRATEAGLHGVDTLAELLAECAVVFSICPPAAAEDVANLVADNGFAGLYVEANAISPQRMIRIAARFGSVVDGSVIGAPPQPDRSSRVYLSGPADEVSRVHGLLAGSRAEPVALSSRIGDASALKMAYGSFNKASAALAAVSHAMAEEYGVGAALLTEGERLGRSVLGDPARLPAVAARAWRWAPEMDEAAESFAAVGLPGELASAAAAVFGRWADDKDNKDNADLDVAEVLRHLRR